MGDVLQRGEEGKREGVIGVFQKGEERGWFDLDKNETPFQSEFCCKSLLGKGLVTNKHMAVLELVNRRWFRGFGGHSSLKIYQ